MTKKSTITLIICSLVLVLSLASPTSAAASPSLNLFLVSAVAAGGAAITWKAFTKEPPYQPVENSLLDKLVVITGGTAGLGLESAKRLTAAGATVVLTSRTAVKGDRAIEKVISYLTEQNVAKANTGEVYSATLDLDDLEAVKRFPERLDAALGPDLQDKKIDVLINNAGIFPQADRRTTKDGFEQAFQSNHLGHFVLTASLFHKLAPTARIISVSSMIHQLPFSGLPINDLNGEKYYSAWYNYGVSKLANIMFTKELQRRAGTTGLKSFSLHPGMVQTDIIRPFMGVEESWESIMKNGPMALLGQLTIAPSFNLFGVTVEDGASTQIFLASASDEILEAVGAEGGDYFVDMKPVQSSSAATDITVAQQLWTESEEMGKIKFSVL